MKVTILLADSAQAINGKLYILGGGWSIADPGPIVMAIAMKIEVPWDQANVRHRFKLSLLTADGQPVKVATPTGDRPLELEREVPGPGRRGVAGQRLVRVRLRPPRQLQFALKLNW